MKSLPRLLGVFLAFAAFAAPTPAQSSVREKRLAAAAVLALGEPPATANVALAGAAGDASLAALYQSFRDRLATDPHLRRAVLARAATDAFGDAAVGELTNSDATLTYTELVQRHLAWLAQHPAEYRTILDRAYRRVVSRPAFDEELAYWRTHSPTPVSYVLVLGCLDDWARRNQPGLMVTTGTPTVSLNCPHVIAYRLPPSIAEEARALVGLPGDASALAAGHTLIAPGAGSLVSAGGIHLLVVGRESDAR